MARTSVVADAVAAVVVEASVVGKTERQVKEKAAAFWWAARYIYNKEQEGVKWVVEQLDNWLMGAETVPVSYNRARKAGAVYEDFHRGKDGRRSLLTIKKVQRTYDAVAIRNDRRAYVEALCEVCGN
jgi:hypothetical protein